MARTRPTPQLLNRPNGLTLLGRLTVFMVIAGTALLASAAEPGSPRLAEATETIRIRLGMRVVAADGPCLGIRCGFPVPVNWPEQELEIETRTLEGSIRGVTLRDLGGVRQARFLVSRLKQGETATLAYTLVAKRRAIEPPQEPSTLRVPSRPDAKLKLFLGPSPKIETAHPTVKEAAAELRFEDGESAWERAAKIHRFTEQRVEYTGVKQLQGALKALQTGGGDCEERTSVFVALCRLHKIPARSVWIPGHAYAEFYLEDRQGRGHWFPAESVGGRFGYMGDGFVILQKGDRFRDPLKRGLQRYLTETAAGNLRPGAAPPRIESIREQILPEGTVKRLP